MKKQPTKEKKMVNGFPRRNRMDLWCPAEKAIQDATWKVEEAGAHPLLTEAVILLGQAREKVADFIELEKLKQI
jgi:hypothetical protein